MPSPTSRSKGHLKQAGWPFVRVVEHWNPFARKRQDLWGADIIALRDNETLLVQTTTGANVSARVKKVTTEFAGELASWLSQPTHHYHVHGWSKQGPRGKRKTWQLRTVDLRTVNDRTELPPPDTAVASKKNVQ